MPNQFVHHQLKIKQASGGSNPENGSTIKNFEVIQAKLKHAKHYLELKGFEVSQHNGQRISKMISIDEKQIQEKSEVFIGKLPRDLYEDELLPFLEKAGRVYKIRLMMEFSGCNRGFAFANYVTSQEASIACVLLSETLIRLNAPPIAVVKSFDNKCLFFGNLPVKVTKKTLLTELKHYLNEVEDVELFKVAPDSSSRFAHVYFKTHDAATQARRLLIPGDVKMFNRVITVDWVKKEAPTRDRPSGQQQQQQLRPLLTTHFQHPQPLEPSLPAQLINLNNNNNINSNQANDQFMTLDDSSNIINIPEKVPLLPLVSSPILGTKAMHMLDPCRFNYQLLHYI